MMEVLMCRPEYYTVSYKINPWMNPLRKPEKSMADHQWNALYQVLKKTGMKIRLIPPEPFLPDMVFTANGGLVFDNIFILSNFRHPERQPETARFQAWAQAKGFDVRCLPQGHYFEGEGDALVFGEILVAGFRFRSDIRSHLHVGMILQREVLSVELVDPDYYHLDTCFCPLDPASALYYPDAFDEYGKKVLERTVPNLIPVSTEDARRFCCNAIVSGKSVIMNHCSTALKEILENLGFTLYLLEFSEFMKSGGSSKCMVLLIRKRTSSGIR